MINLVVPIELYNSTRIIVHNLVGSLYSRYYNVEQRLPIKARKIIIAKFCDSIRLTTTYPIDRGALFTCGKRLPAREQSSSTGL